MKRKHKNWLTVGGILGAATATIWLTANRRLFFINAATTDPDPNYPELRAHVYFAQPEQVVDAAIAAVKSLDHWQVVHTNSDEHVVVAEAESRFGSFLQDVTINVLPLGPQHVRVRIASQSREGRGDLGENAKNIRDFQAAMDRLLVGG